MEKRTFAVLVMILNMWSVCFAYIQNNESCNQYQNLPVQCQLVYPYGLQIDVVAQDSSVIPSIDSVQITTRIGKDAPQLLFTTKAQWGDTIDLSRLIGSMESAYRCIIWMDSCFVSKPFDFHGWCEEYKDVAVSFTTINPHALIIQLEDTVSGSAPLVDSIWITTTAYRGFPEPLLTGHAQSGDTIDLTPLVGSEEWVFLCWFRLGDCVINGQFFFSGEEWDYCLDYADYHLFAWTEDNTLYYDLTDYGRYEPIAVDSVWVSNPDDLQTPLLVSQAQNSEAIDASMLDKGNYQIFAQIGGCLKTASFYKWAEAAPLAIDNQTTNDQQLTTTKILRDGQILILRGDRTYTLTGLEVK